MALSLILLMGLSLALTGCMSGEEPETGLNVLGEERLEEDFEGNTPEEGYVFYGIHVELENKAENLDLEPESDYFILETVDGEEYHDPQGEEIPYTIEPGESESFWLIFDMPEDESAELIRYEPS